MSYKYMVEVGRVALGTRGPAKGKLFAIVDVIDYNKVLIDGPVTGVTRQAYQLKNLRLTGYKLKILRSQKAKAVRLAWVTANITSRAKNQHFAKDKRRQAKRANLNDLERTRVHSLKKRLAAAVNSKVKMLRFSRRKHLKNVEEKNRKVKIEARAAKKKERDAKNPPKHFALMRRNKKRKEEAKAAPKTDLKKKHHRSKRTKGAKIPKAKVLSKKVRKSVKPKAKTAAK